MSSKQMRLTIPAVAILFAGGIWWQRAAHAEQAEGRTVWEFATVEALPDVTQGSVRYSAASVCYHVNNGCRVEGVRVEALKQQTNAAVAAAASRLGESGWDLVSVTPRGEFLQPTMVLKREVPARR